METKRPFARVAGWAALWFALGALVLSFLPLVVEPMSDALPALPWVLLSGLVALGRFLCAAAAVACGVIALCGIPAHGRKGILGPAAGGLALAAMLLVPILSNMASGFAGHARLVKAREVTPAPVAHSTTSAPPVSPAPAK